MGATPREGWPCRAPVPDHLEPAECGDNEDQAENEAYHRDPREDAGLERRISNSLEPQIKRGKVAPIHEHEEPYGHRANTQRKRDDWIKFGSHDVFGLRDSLGLVSIHKVYRCSGRRCAPLSEIT